MGQVNPTAESIGDMYDQYAEMTTHLYGGSDPTNGNIHAGYWDDPADGSSLAAATDRLTDLVGEYMRTSEGASVLDVGCGTGKPALRLACQLGVRVTGVSVSRQQVDMATAQAQALRLTDSVTFQHADAMALPFDNDSFDAAIAIESLLHMPDPVRALREIARVLRPGGHLAAVEQFLRRPVVDEEKATIDGFCEMSQIRKFAQLDDYRALLAETGWELLELRDIGDNVRPTYAATAAAIEQARDNFASTLGSELFDTMLIGIGRFSAISALGYVLIQARLPELS